MIKFFQISAFYSVLGLIVTGLFGYYPRIDPTYFALDKHMKTGTYVIYFLLFVQIFGIVLSFLKRKELKQVFYKTELKAEELKKELKQHNFLLMALFINFIFVIVPLITGIRLKMGLMSKAMHFHGNSTCLLLLCFAFLYIGSKLDSIQRTIDNYRKQANFDYKEPKFLDDEHSRGFQLALKFLFLGINVWMPYLILKYGIGLSMLNGLYFLPIHLAGVLPFSYLKRKHKFQRTINPNYQGTIKKSHLYKSL